MRAAFCARASKTARNDARASIFCALASIALGVTLAGCDRQILLGALAVTAPDGGGEDAAMMDDAMTADAPPHDASAGDATTPDAASPDLAPRVPVLTATVQVGMDPVSAALADFDGDGQLDAVTANHGAASVTVLLGDGHGGFAPGRDFAVDAQPIAVVAGHFVGSATGQLPGVATASSVQRSVTIALAAGKGALAPSSTSPVGMAPASLVAADLDGDGRDDLAVADPVGGAVDVLLGPLGSSVTTPTVIAISGAPSCVTAGPVRSATLDLLIGYRDNFDLTLLDGDGHGKFTVGISTGIFADNLAAVALADVNNDGLLDAIAAARNGKIGAIVMVAFGVTGGGYSPSAAMYGVGQGVSAMALGDFDGDGLLDLATANAMDGTLSVLGGRAGGTFAPGVTLAVGGVSAVAAGDLDGDHRAELIATSSTTNVLLVYRER